MAIRAKSCIFCFVKVEIKLYYPQKCKDSKNPMGNKIIFAKMKNAVANSLEITIWPIKVVVIVLIIRLNLCLW